MYKYFCKLSLGLKFGEFYFGFTGYNMPMSKACKIWNKPSGSLSVIYVKRPVCLCLMSAFYLYAYTCGYTHIYKTKIQPFVKVKFFYRRLT